MKKTSLIYVLIILVAMVLIPNSQVFAGKIETLEANGNNGKITVSGTSENGVLAVAVSVYNEDETKLITTETTSVDNNNKYSYSIDMKEGNYVVKVADYDGGEYESKKVTVEKSAEKSENAKTEDSTNKEENSSTTDSNKKGNTANPITGDNIMVLVAIFAVSAIGTMFVIKRNKKAKISKH